MLEPCPSCNTCNLLPDFSRDSYTCSRCGNTFTGEFLYKTQRTRKRPPASYADRVYELQAENDRLRESNKLLKRQVSDLGTRCQTYQKRLGAAKELYRVAASFAHNCYAGDETSDEEIEQQITRLLEKVEYFAGVMDSTSYKTTAVTPPQTYHFPFSLNEVDDLSAPKLTPNTMVMLWEQNLVTTETLLKESWLISESQLNELIMKRKLQKYLATKLKLLLMKKELS